MSERTELGDELRLMIHEAREYLEGRSSLSGLNGQVSIAQRAMNRGEPSHPAIAAMLDEWIRMINRRWNEWGTEAEPLSEDDFRLWLTAQLDRTGPT